MMNVYRYILLGIKKWKYYRGISTLLMFTFIGILLVCGLAISGKTRSIKSVEYFIRPDSTGSLKTFEVTGRITQTFSYCGGAAPPKQILEKLATPIAYSGKRFYIRYGKINNIKARVIKNFITGKDGEFSIRLTPGMYSIILEEQLKKIKTGDLIKQNIHVDKKCLDEWWSKPYYILEINDKDINQLNFNFHHPCFISKDIPCLQYVGPPAP